MLNVPDSMKPTLDYWKANHNLGEGMRFQLNSWDSPGQYENLMDQVIMTDNDSAKDSAPEKGLVVFKDDEETHRYHGDSRKGDLESVTADGRVLALNFDEKGVDFLQLTQNDKGVEALHQHYDRQGGQGWMQVGGAITVIDADDPDIWSKITQGTK